MRDIWFWQEIVSPHVAPLAEALARAGCRVSYVSQHDLTADRRAQGWTVPSLTGVNVLRAHRRPEIEALVAAARRDAVHVCGGLRGAGSIPSLAGRVLAGRGLGRWVLMETPDDAVWQGPLKTGLYSALFRWQGGRIIGVLAIGHRTPAWVTARGVAREQVFPFAYFLEDRPAHAAPTANQDEPFRVVFVGQFIERKRLPLLIRALEPMRSLPVELVVVGSGPLEGTWRTDAERRLPGRVRWLGRLPSREVWAVLESADCLVLPSRHDGWGAVISEALMSGTPVICSDSCGAAGVVSASGVGGVFTRGDAAGLARQLERAVANGRPLPEDRRRLSRWAASVGAEAGARYLLEILDHRDGTAPRPEAPWSRQTPPCAD